MHFLSIPSRTVQNLPISSVSPLSYVSEVNVPSLNLTAVTNSSKDVFISIICELKRQLVVIIYLPYARKF